MSDADQNGGDHALPHRPAPTPSVSYVPGGTAQVQIEMNTHPRLNKSYSMPTKKNDGPSGTSQSARPTPTESRRPPTMSRALSVRDTVTSNVNTFFGVPTPTTPNKPDRQRWENRRLRHCSRRYGALKTPVTRDVDFSDQIIGQLQTPGPMPSSARYSTNEPPMPLKFTSAPLPESDDPLRRSTSSTMNRSVSHDSKAHIKIVQRRDSVYKMAWDGFTTLLTRGTARPRESYASAQRRARLRSHSFTPGSIAVDDSVFDVDDGAGSTFNESGDSAQLSVMSGSSGFAFDRGSQQRDHQPPMPAIEEEAGGSRKASLHAQQTPPPPRPHKRGESASPPPLPPRLRVSPVDQRRDTSEYRPDSLDIDEIDVPLHVIQTASLRHPAAGGERATEETDGPPVNLDSSISLQDDVFFDLPPHHYHVHFPHATTAQPTRDGHYHVRDVRLPKHGRRPGRDRTPERQAASRRLMEYPPVQPTDTLSSQRAVLDEPIARQQQLHGDQAAINAVYTGRQPPPPVPHHRGQGVRQLKHRSKKPPGLRVKTAPDAPSPPADWSLQNIWNKMFAASNSDRRRYGEGIIGKLFNRTLKRRRHLPDHVLKQLDDYDDFRPFFTYWVTTVQILVLVFSIALYGFAPFGFFGRRQMTEKVTHRTLIKQQVAYLEQENFWLGPRFADLIHLGAKYSPCMRPDQRHYDVINSDRRRENATACCIYNDKSGCFQATEGQCPQSLATHHKWSSSQPSPAGRTSGSVCGQDPEACVEPPSISPYEWPDDITKWPICTDTGSVELSSLPNMACELTGRPCCIGIHGQCRITTREYCDFVRGYYHEAAFLCSQVSCMSEVCGMLPFFSADTPDQWYRLFISLFIHAGVIHLLTTVLIQMVFMRDFEKLIGWERMAIIYLLSGMAGYLASATFVPNIPEVGPAGSHFGLLAGMYADLWHSRKLVEHPWKAFVQLSIITCLSFLLGFLPWIDNWAHLFGFIIGLCLSLAMFPYIQFDDEDPKHERTKRLTLVYTCLVLSVCLLLLLFLVFYIFPIWSCPFCQYFNCVPFWFAADEFCANQGTDLVPMQGLEPI